MEILTTMAARSSAGPMELQIQPSRLRAIRIAWSLSLLLCIHFGPPLTASAQDTIPEYQVKAAYLYNFLKFVEWPSDAFTDSLAPIVIGVLGDDPFGTALPEVVIGKTVQGRDLVIRRYRAGENLRGATILFISISEKKRLPQIVAGLRGSTVLTVADMDGFLDAGGMIQFLSENDLVRFAINVDAVSAARLKVSSKLLSLARVFGNKAN
jgi:hypothetical protein